MTREPFYPPDIETLARWILAGEAESRVLGLPRGLWFSPRPDDPFKISRYGRALETPLGVAAGPQTQLATGILAAYLAGARYIELKTVQILDRLTVTKPCIFMAGLGLNCEWSQELLLDQSFDQYLDAWILCHWLKDRYGWGTPAEPGFLFNMSLGYNLEGIQSPVLQRFLNKMSHCAKEKAEKIDRLARVDARFRDLMIPDRISDNVTLSTMHGCPPDEIEKIGRYLIGEKRLHTTIKLNPTLLGAADVRRILNDTLGLRVTVPDEAFGHDLKWNDALGLIRRLGDLAQSVGVHFGLKLTNTLETVNDGGRLPPNEAMVYLSGRALHPISIRLAHRLREEFGPDLDLSFCAGADCFNIADVLASGLRPVTVCSDLLQPGGYGRLSQYMEILRNHVPSRPSADEGPAAMVRLADYADRVVRDVRYHQPGPAPAGVKTDRPLPLFDCAAAPCMAGCPAGQDIPRYLGLAAQGQWNEAHAVILGTNPWPNVLGQVCGHPCQFKCTRQNLDAPLQIRDVKRAVAALANAESAPTSPPAELNVAVIGAGPSGLAAAWFLARAGAQVDVFDAGNEPGGMAVRGIPSFRLDKTSLDRDIEAVRSLGVRIHPNQTIDAARFEALRTAFDYVYLAVGARKSVPVEIPGIETPGVFDFLTFLEAVSQGTPPRIGPRVVVVGGGNSALDVARTAKRLVGPAGRVAILYRRTREQMPADSEEIQAGIEEGIDLVELAAPVRVVEQKGRMTGIEVERMALGPKDQSGRPRPVRVSGSSFFIEAETLIPAVGQIVAAPFFPQGPLAVNPETLETSLPGVLAGGDAVRGPATLVQAVADGRRAAAAILDRAGFLGLAEEVRRGRPGLFLPDAFPEPAPDMDSLQIRQARRQYPVVPAEPKPENRMGFAPYAPMLDEAAARLEAGRCLRCDRVCNVCVSVCPNRANQAVRMEPFSYPVQTARPEPDGLVIETHGQVRIGQPFQVIHLADLCNECGNCQTFCPSNGSPYRDKPRFHLSLESFNAGETGYHFNAHGALAIRNPEGPAHLTPDGDGFIYDDGIMTVHLDRSLAARRVDLKPSEIGPVDLEPAARAAVVYRIGRRCLEAWTFGEKE